MGRANGLPRAKDVKPFSDAVWVTERSGVSRSRSARMRRLVSGVLGRHAKSPSPTAVDEESKKEET